MESDSVMSFKSINIRGDGGPRLGSPSYHQAWCVTHSPVNDSCQTQQNMMRQVTLIGFKLPSHQRLST